MAKPKQEDMYRSGVETAGALEGEYSGKANLIQQAYESAVLELGYSDKELMDVQNAESVANLMFSDKYLGNKDFNPLLKEKKYAGFEDLSIPKQQREYQNMLGMNLDSFIAGNGIIARYGDLRRTTVANALTRQEESQTTQDVMTWAWHKVYDTNKSTAENIQAYTDLLKQDPILAATGADLDAGKFKSVDDVAQALSQSLMGQKTREDFRFRHGVNFN